jgi:uncharacterized membrane protein YcaP (DUF421 family)
MIDHAARLCRVKLGLGWNSELLTQHELAAAFRAAGCSDIRHVHFATIENNGQISVTLHSEPA